MTAMNKGEYYMKPVSHVGPGPETGPTLQRSGQFHLYRMLTKKNEVNYNYKVGGRIDAKGLTIQNIFPACSKRKIGNFIKTLRRYL